MKKPTDMKKIEQDVTEVIKNNSNQPHWKAEKKEDHIDDDKLVGVSIRVPNSVKKNIEEITLKNRKEGKFPNSLTTFIVQAIHEHIERNKD